ncbi:MAG: DUF4293 family protein [Chitinophagaceae bacterium]|nr:MAG: DUF4293 family protein [Chitinophagaceae bacterium]
MIQRIQSIWILAATACTLLTIKFPFYSGNLLPLDQEGTFVELTAKSNIVLLLFAIVIATKCLFILFLYKNRGLQLALTIGATAFSILFILVFTLEMKNYVNGNLSLTATIAFAIPVFLFLAARGIWKDKQLLKNSDRLR